MRLTLMVLSILRALPMARTAFISLVLAVFVAASSTYAPALQSRMPQLFGEKAVEQRLRANVGLFERGIFK